MGSQDFVVESIIQRGCVLKDKMKFWLIFCGFVLCAFANEENGRDETTEKKPGQQRHGYGGYPGYSAYGYAPPKHYGYQPPKSYGYQQSYSDYGYQPQTNYGYQYKEPQVYGFTYNDAHIDHTINKVKQYAYAQDAYKSQQLNVKVDWDIQPENYGYASKYYGAIPQTVGSIYTGYGGYLNPYGFGTPNPYGYGPPNSYGYGVPNTYGYGAPNPYGYGAPNPYGYGAPNPYGYGAPNPYGYGAHKPYGSNKEPKQEILNTSEPEEFEHHWGDPHE